VQTRVAGALALIGGDDQGLPDGEVTRVQTAKPHDAHTWSRRPSVPGIGKMWRVVWRYASHALRRFPRVHAVVSSGRLVTCAQDSAGNRDGTSGAKIGQADRTWAFSAAAVRCRRTTPVGQTALRRVENNHGQGKA
jgi:hypothetical protein